MPIEAYPCEPGTHEPAILHRTGGQDARFFNRCGKCGYEIYRTTKNPVWRVSVGADGPIPRDSNFPADSVQCDACGGWGGGRGSECPTCKGKGWLSPKSHPNGRKCENPRCRKPLPPTQVAVYCSNECAAEDA
jgi:hypothetical protein